MPEATRHLLLVEDEAALREAVAEQLADRGYQVEQADSGESAVAQLADFAFDIIITDLRLPGIDGSAVVEAAVERYPDIIAIVITGYGTVKDAVDAIKRGARDFVSKPFQIDELLHVLDSALEQRRLRSENAYLRAQLEERYRFDQGIVGKSRPMARLFQLLETVATTSSTILVTGETGSGKEVVARAIHQHSPRRLQRFVALNCSAIPETLLEAELFGHVRGAFTGAVGNRQGRLEQAHKGTLFLDEVGTMSSALQMKLLRVLQEREFERIGDSHTTKVDVRVIAATNSDLGRMVADGHLSRGPLLPSERHPRADSAAARPQRRHPAARAALPRQVPSRRRRRRAVVDDGLAGGDASPDAVPLARERPAARECDRARRRVQRRPLADRRPGSAAGHSADTRRRRPRRRLHCRRTASISPEYVGRIERELIQLSLERTGGNKGQAARLLNLKRTTLVEKLKRL